MSPDLTRNERLVTDSVAPGDSASHAGAESPDHSVLAATPELPPSEIPFPFKFKAPSGRVHRLQVIAAHGIAELVANVTSKLGSEVEGIGGAPVVEDGKVGAGGYALSYLDDEGDSVSITTDHDLLEAILLARQGGRDKVDLFVHDPEKPPTAPAPAAPVLPEPVVAVATPPTSSVVRERRRPLAEDEDEDDEEDDEDESRVRRARKTRTAPQPAEQVIAGVPNELLLPGAIVALAVVIVGVFTISRVSSR
jgi:CBS domain-containing protein